MNRNGQVFLVAAIIITGILLTLTRISNKTLSREKPEAFYDLSEEIDFEVKRVLDYGVINGGQNIGVMASELINNYSEYIADEDVVFVYGNKTNVSALYYRSLTNLNAVSLGAISAPIKVNLASHTSVEIKPLDPINSKATIKINDVDYNFKIKPGQNFYFVLIKKEEGEKYVTIE